MVRVTQINLHHSKAASAALLLRLAQREEGLVLVQEPWIHQDQVSGLNMKGYRLYHAKGAGKIRSCILAKSSLNIFILSDYSDEDTVTVSWETSDGDLLWLISSYMAHDHGDRPPNGLIRSAVDKANETRTPVVICADANSHHIIWGSSDTNIRGENLFKFILNSSLEVVNRGSEPTFIVTNRSEVLDLTLVSAQHRSIVSNWAVSRDCSFSDHQYIDFEINIGVYNLNANIILNRRKTNWERQHEVLAQSLISPPVIECRDDIEVAVGILTDSFRSATSIACRPVTRKGKNKPPWWNPEIAHARSECRKLFNEAKRLGNWSEYKTSVNHFKNLTRNAKRKAWRTFCSGVEGSSETNRLRKILSTSPVVPGYIQKPCGSWTMSSNETLEVLLDTHFPGCLPVNNDSVELASDFDVPCINSVPMDGERLHWAINSFDPFKSPGLDGIIPADLQKNEDIVTPWLTNIFTACIRWTYIPTCWTKCKVVFIPKGGKVTHTKPKDYRPISLASFMLKTLERVIDIHLRMTIPSELISKSQHAYTKGRSVETALHSLVGSIEESMSRKEYSLVAFLDIEGAFNNIKPSAILSAMESLGIDLCICRIIERMLCNRVIYATLGSAEISKRADRGTPQGGVLSPLLWNIAMNTLLLEMDGKRIKTVAYADDVAVCISGKFPDTITSCMESALSTLSGWSALNGLSVNPLKTELVLFTRRYRIEEFRPPRLNGISLEFRDNAKYLGIILDRKLSWNLNIQSRINKAYVAIYACKRAIGTRWGIGPKGVNWIFKAVVKPILFYGVLVWWQAMDTASHLKAVERVLRTIAIMITGAIKSTPTKALFTILNWLPVDLMVIQMALNSAVRLNAGGSWSGRNIGHSRIMDNYGHIHGNVDYCVARPFFNTQFRTIIPNRDEWLNGTHPPDGIIRVYTDGSKRGGNVGGGFFIENYGIRSYFRLPNFCTVLQAEISAIKRASNWLRYYHISGDICIFTDSKAAVKGIAGVFTTSRLTEECRVSLNEIARHSRITLIWVPGHCGDQGNYVADDLAKRGAMLGDEAIDTFLGISLANCKVMVQQGLYETAQNRWTNESTCAVARSTWPVYDANRTGQLMSFRREQIRLIVSTITGHCLIGTHARRLGLRFNDYCRSCHDEEEEETVSHLFCHCPALSNLRERLFGTPFLSGLEELSGIRLRLIYTFIGESGWFESEAVSVG